MRLIEPFFLLLTLILLLRLFPAFCIQQKFPLPFSDQEDQEMVEDKMRLGSTPPNCHNHCNRCNPCTPVQVVHTRSGPDHRGRRRFPSMPLGYVDHYSNYKPLGWKCRCNQQLYDP